MRNVHIDYHGPDQGFQAASLLAKDAAKDNQMKDPTIIAWHRSNRLGATPPYYDGANPETWWEKYGEGNGGRLEVSVGNDYQFIMMDARGFETVGDLPLRNLTDKATAISTSAIRPSRVWTPPFPGRKPARSWTAGWPTSTEAAL